ncbi:MAG: outer membrane protein [Pseudomonadota bacterium]
MSKKINAFAAICVGLLSASAAYAADAVEVPPAPPVSQEPVVQYAPSGSWSGIYAGAFAGYNWGTFDSTAGDIDADGWMGGAFVGYNLQNGPIVYGAEGDLGFSGAGGSVGAVDVDQGVFGSLRARLGYQLDPVLLYGTAGVAATQAEVTDASGSDSNTHLGWTVGAGADALLTDNVFGRLEYRYSDYESKDFTTPATAVSSGFSDHRVRAGIGIKF